MGSATDKTHGHLHKRTLAANLEGRMRVEAVLTAEADSTSNEHLLQHYERDTLQEDLCFALWRPSTGKLRRTALIDEIILPQEGERLLHGNVSFEPTYLARAMKIALQKRRGWRLCTAIQAVDGRE